MRRQVQEYEGLHFYTHSGNGFYIGIVLLILLKG